MRTGPTPPVSARPAVLRRVWRWIRAPLALALVAFLLDLALAFRVSYMGVSDEKVSDLVMNELLGVVLTAQAEIVGFLVAISTLMWALHAAVLGLRGRAAWIGTLATWALLLVVHARRWPALYTDLRDIRPIPDALFEGMVEGAAGWVAIAGLGAVTGVLALRAARRRSARGRLATGAGLALIGLLAWQVGRPPTPPTWTRTPGRDPAQPDVLLLMTDSWRADAFECRADSTRTPRLGALCARYGGQHWTAYAPQPRTFGSVAALFTGLAPDESGVHHMMAPAAQRDLRQRSLVQRFTARGYRTVAVAGFAGDVFPRVALGFETVSTPTFGFQVVIREFSYRAHPLLFPFLATHAFTRAHVAPVYRTFMDLADPTLEAAPAYALAGEADPRPLFMTVFLSTTHSPYAVHAGLARRRGRDPVEFRYRHHPPAYQGRALTAPQIAAVRHRYADAVQAVDDALGRLAEAALAKGNTLVVITSDHGELLYEFGDANHGDHVFGDQHLAVPVIALDGRAVAPKAPPPGPGLYALKDLLGQIVEAVTDGTALRLPERAAIFAESGIIISPLGPQVIEGHRVDYPQVLDLLRLDHAVGDLTVRPEWAPVVERGKFRLWLTPEWAFVYSPGCKAPRMSMVPRGAQVRALPADSVHAAHPAAINAAWAAMRRRWPDQVRRDACGDALR